MTPEQRDAYMEAAVRMQEARIQLDQSRAQARLQAAYREGIRTRLLARNTKRRRFPLSRKGKIARPKGGEKAVTINVSSGMDGFCDSVPLSTHLKLPWLPGLSPVSLICRTDLMKLNIDVLILANMLPRGTRLETDFETYGPHRYFVTIPSRPARMSKKLQAHFER